MPIKNNNQAGQSVLELMIAMSIFVIVVSGIMFLVLDAQSANRQGAERTQAAFLSQEAFEATQSIANQGWRNLTDGSYGLDNSVGYWELSGLSEVFADRFVRQVIIETVYRDVGGDIVETGGTIDYDTKKITTTTSWDFTTARPSEVVLINYLTNWHSVKWLETTQADLAAGTTNQTVVTNNEGGEVELATLSSENHNDWPFDVPANYSYNPNDIEVTGSNAQLANAGLDGSGGTANSDFESGTEPWTYNDWDYDSGEVNPVVNRRNGDGNPGRYGRIRFPRRSLNDQVGGYIEQSFTVTESDSTNAYVNFDWSVLDYSTPDEPLSLEVMVFLDSTSGEPMHGTEIWSSGNLNSITSYSSESVDITTLVTTPGTYYLKLAAWLVSGDPRTNSRIDIGFDNALAYWEKESSNYLSTGPSIEPTSSFIPASIDSWSGFEEISDKPLAPVISWWDSNYQYRLPITVYTEANYPYGGYDGYTVRVTGLDSSSLVSGGKLLANCNDLRMARDNGVGWTELDREVIDCDTVNTEVRWRLQADIGTSSSDTSYYIYYGYNGAGSPPNDLNNVYQWYDDATTNNLSSYVLGRGDAWHGTGYQACAYNGAGQYYDSCGDADNATATMRRAVSERDVYIEADMYYDCGWPSNMTTGLLARYNLAGGSGSSESADHYYASNRAEIDSGQSCGGGLSGSGYNHDGDILKTERTSTAIDGVDNSDVASDQWTKQGLAVWGINPTNAKFWNSDTVAGFGPVGWPSVATLASGSDAIDYENPGEAGIIVAQNRMRVRNMLIRRYVEPEPSTSLSSEEQYSAGPSGELYYQLSDDNGFTWKYWDGGTWSVAGVSDYNTDDVLNTNIGSFPATASGILFKAFLVSDGTVQIRLDNIRIKYLMPGGTDYQTNGDFTSNAYDTASEFTIYNYIDFTVDEPAGTDVRWQLRTADTQANLSVATWVGPDGTGATFYDTPGQLIAVDPGRSGVRWIQYKAYLTGDGTSTPIINDITIDYEE